MRITKVQALGNDFVLADALFGGSVIENSPGLWARFLCSRHYGVGGDGLIIVCPSETADVRMRIFNPDGTEAEMCGNALRSTGLYVFSSGVVTRADMTVETIGGVKQVFMHIKDGAVDTITAQVNPPGLSPSSVPVLTEGETCLDHPVVIEDRTFLMSAMSMGNPHCVSFVGDIDGFDLVRYGGQMSRHSIFPRQVNAEFAQIDAPGHLSMRVYERSVGETLACATGSCVAVVGGFLTGRCAPVAEVRQRGGGIIGVEYDGAGGRLFMRGPSQIVFTAEMDPVLPAAFSL